MLYLATDSILTAGSGWAPPVGTAPGALYDAGFLFPLGLQPLLDLCLGGLLSAAALEIFRGSRRATGWARPFSSGVCRTSSPREHLPALGWVGTARSAHLSGAPEMVVYGVLWIADCFLIKPNGSTDRSGGLLVIPAYSGTVFSFAENFRWKAHVAGSAEKVRPFP